jgi:predicted ATPase/DNA-binding SARP family transcriptional activator
LRRGRATEFQLLGAVRAGSDGQVVPLGAPKQRALLAELLLHAGEVLSRDHLVDALWGERPPSSAHNTLQVYVHGLRRALGPDRIETHGSGYRVRLEPGELDAARFEQLLASAERSLAGGDPGGAVEDVERALALWTGSPLADIADQPVARVQAPRLEELRLRALEVRADARLELEKGAILVPELEALLAEHPYRERLRAQLALALYRAGRQADALETIREARRRLVDDLGVEPGPELQELERAVLRHDPALTLPAREAPARLRDLPVPPTPLIGRRLEIAAVEALLRREECRLVTLTGPGGTGKTRLALAAASALAPELRDGAAFVDLSQIHERQLVLPTIALALELGEEDLISELRRRSLLLVLDNLEQLGDETGPVAELLAGAPRLRVLATSRTPLRLSGEREYPVPPLPVPASGAAPEELAANEAVQLFVARAQAVDPSFALTAGTSESVAAICRRLDGLPLALELAAARVRSLTPAALEQRLRRALQLLVAGARDVPPRQRTLRATLDWSHDLLGEPERRLFAHLAVFSGGFLLDDLEAIAGEECALELAGLVDASLVRRRDDRFHLLETVREYAVERLSALGAGPAYRRRHALHYVARAEAAAEKMSTAEEPAAYAFFDAEQENLWAALEWAAEACDLDVELRLACAQRWYWHVRGRLEEGRLVFERLQAATEGADPGLRASALVRGGLFPYRQGDMAAARDCFEEALALYRQLDDSDGVARSIAELGAVAVGEGDLERADALYREAIPLFQQLGQPARVATSLSNLAAIASRRSELDDAIDYGLRAIALQRELGDTDGLAISLINTAGAQLERGDLSRAEAPLSEGLSIACSIGFREVTAYGLAAGARLMLARGELQHSVRLLRAAGALFDALGITLTGDERESYDATRAKLCEELGGAQVDELMAGRDDASPEQLAGELTAALSRGGTDDE